ncbi:MAG: LacI family transcriptional regulator [Acidobacteriaceae bacterium]|nr:LacI family transcriptional regulator [Acidobacteriaceae bacterium]
MPRRKTSSTFVTIIDVARESGFSPSTVSIVLNEAPLSVRIAQTTKERIRKTAEELGYRPNASARLLRTRRSQTIGVMIFDLSDPFCTLILRGIEQALQPTQYLPILMDANNNRKQLGGYLDLLMDRRVEGLVVVANWLFEAGGLLAKLDNGRLPTIVVGRDLSQDGIRSVVVENQQGGYLAMQHLYALGHRHIAFIRGPAKLRDSHLRWKGIRAFCAEHDVPIRRELVRQLPASRDPNSEFDGGLALTDELLRSGAAFSAIVAFDDLTALGAVRALHGAGRRVPQDCSVVGFDDVPPAWFSTPDLTTVRQPMEAMGQFAADWVLRELQPGKRGADRSALLCTLEPTLVERGSTQASLKSIDKLRGRA